MSRPNRRTYYRILHVQPDAPEAVISANYRTLLQKLRQHPDFGNDSAGVALIREAYAVLSDPRQRAEYDRLLAQRAGHAAARTGARSARSPVTTPRPPPRLDVCPFCDTPFSVSSAAPLPRRCATCASPLSAPPPARRLSATRRAFERQPLTAAVEYFRRGGNAPRAAQLRNFSPTGAQLGTTERLSAGTILALKTPLFDALARVIDCRAGERRNRYELGLEFLTLALTAPAGSLVSTRA
jgi:curved DNA-binding protein CbpA